MLLGLSKSDFGAWRTQTGGGRRAAEYVFDGDVGGIRGPERRHPSGGRRRYERRYRYTVRGIPERRSRGHPVRERPRGPEGHHDRVGAEPGRIKERNRAAMLLEAAAAAACRMFGIADRRGGNHMLDAPFCRTSPPEYIFTKGFAWVLQVTSPSCEACAGGCRLVVGQR